MLDIRVDELFNFVLVYENIDFVFVNCVWLLMGVYFCCDKDIILLDNRMKIGVVLSILNYESGV